MGIDNETIKRNIETGSRKIQELEREIKRIESAIADRRNDIREIAQRCKVEWYRPKWMKSDAGNKLEELRYWNS